MKDYIHIQLKLDKNLNYALDLHIAALSKFDKKISKADLIVKLMRIGLIKESAKLIEEGRA